MSVLNELWHQGKIMETWADPRSGLLEIHGVVIWPPAYEWTGSFCNINYKSLKVTLNSVHVYFLLHSITHWAFNSSLPLSIPALLHALPNTDWYLSVSQSSDAKHLVNRPTAGALGILKTTQVSEKLYNFSVTRDTSLLGRVVLCAKKMVNMTTCLLHATVSAGYICVWLSVNTILFMLLRGRLMQAVFYTHGANTLACSSIGHFKLAQWPITGGMHNAFTCRQGWPCMWNKLCVRARSLHQHWDGVLIHRWDNKRHNWSKQHPQHTNTSHTR